MKDKTVAALLALNFLVTGGLSALLLTNFKNLPLGGGSNPVPIEVDISGIDKPLAKVSKDLDHLTTSIQRFNTSLVQYDFLKREMDRLAALDQNIGMRAQVAASKKNDENTKEIEEVLAKLSVLSGKVKGEQQVRRQTMLKLISNLEKQLSQIAPPTPVPTPAKPVQAPAENGGPEAPKPVSE